MHGDDAAARIAAQRAVDAFRGAPRDRAAGRYERYFLARALALLGRYDEAVAAIAFRDAADSSDLLYLGLEGVLAAYRGAEGAADEADAKLAALDHPGIAPLVAGQRARIATARGEHERALALLDWATSRGLARVPSGMDLHLDRVYDPLRGDPRFQRLNRGRD